MKLNDKIKELVDNWTAWGKCYDDINRELESKNPNIGKINELLKKRNKISNKREMIMKEAQVLLDKTSADILAKIERLVK